ncbi:MAG TPA: ATP-binding protein [Actinomycetota bacterium]|nr:ATP-binding protein [Actinomycetota bacterium]
MRRGRTHPETAEGLPATIVTEARIVGLRDFSTPSLEAVEHRRIQLWILTSIMLVSISIGVVVLSIWPTTEESAISSSALRWGIVLMSMGFCAYAIDKERHLQKLSRLLTDERVLTAALSNRLRELSLLLQAGKAMNAVLELDAVLDVILRSALELLDGASGSIMLVDGDALVARCVHNNPDALGRRVAIGDGIAGRVARTKEPLLINGRPTSKEFPGLDGRTQAVASAMSVPLIHRDQLLGVLNVNAEPGSAFSAYDLRALSLFAEQGAVAIANARLFDAERAHVVELVELDRMKSEFLGLVTHELRTPLTVVLAAAQAGKQPNSPIETSELFEIIERNGKNLASLVEELLIAARLEQGEATAAPVRVDLPELVRTVARDFGVTDRPVEVEVQEGLATVSDPDAIRRILVNLLDNAHKYGAAPIRVSLEPGEDCVVLSVSDAGPGLPVDERERLFERFRRADNTGKPGLGLGLPIVRGLAASCGGHVWAEDAPGGGAVFRVALPLETASLEAV